MHTVFEKSSLIWLKACLQRTGFAQSEWILWSTLLSNYICSRFWSASLYSFCFQLTSCWEELCSIKDVQKMSLKLISTGEWLSLCNINNMWCPFLQIFCLVVKAQFVINKHVQIFVFVKLLHSLALDNIGIWNRSTCPDAKLRKWILAPLNKVLQQVQGCPFILWGCICPGIWIVCCLSSAGE